MPIVWDGQGVDGEFLRPWLCHRRPWTQCKLHCVVLLIRRCLFHPREEVFCTVVPNVVIASCIITLRENGRDFTRSYNKSPLHSQKIQKATWQDKNVTKNLDYTTGTLRYASFFLGLVKSSGNRNHYNPFGPFYLTKGIRDPCGIHNGLSNNSHPTGVVKLVIRMYYIRRKTIAHVHTADLTFAPGHLTPVCYRSYGLTIILCLRRRVYTISQLEVSVRKKDSGHEYKFAPIHALSNFV